MCNMISPPPPSVYQARIHRQLIAPKNPAKFRIYNSLHPSIPPSYPRPYLHSPVRSLLARALLLRLRLLQDPLHFQPSPRLLKRPSLYPISQLAPASPHHTPLSQIPRVNKVEREYSRRIRLKSIPHSQRHEPPPKPPKHHPLPPLLLRLLPRLHAPQPPRRRIIVALSLRGGAGAGRRR